MPSEPEQRCSGRRHRGRVVCSRQHRSARVRCTSGEKCSHSDLGARTFKRRILPLAHTLVWCTEHVWGGRRRFQRAARAQGATPAARLVWVVWRQNRRFQPRAPCTAATPRGASRTRSGPDPAWRVGRRCQANQSGGAAAAGAAAGSSAVGNTAALVYGVPLRSGEKCSHSDLGARIFKRRIPPLVHTLIWCTEHVWDGQARSNSVAGARVATPAAWLVWVLFGLPPRRRVLTEKSASAATASLKTGAAPLPVLVCDVPSRGNGQRI